MLYKEWRLVRYKFLLWFLGFGFITMSYLFQFLVLRRFEMLVYPWNGKENYTNLFEYWLNQSWNYIPILAVLGGIDLISEETGRGTLSFLLAKPLARTRLYLTKVGLNSLVLSGVIGLWSLVVLLMDQLPHTVDISKWNSVSDGTATYFGMPHIGTGPAHPAELFPALLSVLMVVLLCSAIAAMVGLFSIFTRNVLQTLAISILPLGLLMFGFVQLGKEFNSQVNIRTEGGMTGNPIGEIPLVAGAWEGRLVGVVLLAVLAGLCIGSGVFLFQRKKF